MCTAVVTTSSTVTSRSLCRASFQMPYRILEHESVEEGLRRVSREQIHRAINEIDGDLGLHETVHQVRKRCKKVRAVLRLVRLEAGFSYSHENARFRDAARRLSDLRDLTARLETFDLLMNRFEETEQTARFSPIHNALEASRRDFVTNGIDAEARMSSFRDEMEKAWEDVGDWTLSTEGFTAVRKGLMKTYRRGRKALRKAYADPSDDRFHELRKRAKYHWYHMRLLQDGWKPVVKARCTQQQYVSDLLGDDHDLAILRRTLLREAGRFEMHALVDDCLRLLAKRRAELQTDARFAAERLYAEPPEALADRFNTYWMTWREETRLVARTTPLEHA